MAVAAKDSPAQTLAQSARAERDRLLTRAAQLAEASSSPTTAATVEELLREADRLDKRARRYKRAARVKREPRTYTAFGTASYFRDLIHRQNADPRLAEPARDRLARHRHESDVERRTNPSTTAGQGGEFGVPEWAVDQFSTPARAGRVLADLVPNLLLPAGRSSVHVPRITTGADAAIQSAQGQPAQTVDQVTADVPNTSVVTITGDVDASQQLLDLSPPTPGYDWIVLVDLGRAYNQSLEKQMMTGTGTNGQLTGVTVVTGRNTDVSGAGVSATQATGVPQLWPLIGQACASVGNNRLLPAEHVLMAPRRWEWIASALDNSSRPIASPGQYAHQSDFPAVGSANLQPFTILGHPAYQTGAIAASSNADVVIAIRPSDALLYESVPHFMLVENPLAGTLQVRLQLRKYVAFPILRPTGICVVTAIPAPTAF